MKTSCNKTSKTIKSLLLIATALTSTNTLALKLNLADVSSGYSNCEVRQSSLDATFYTTIKYNHAKGRTGPHRFVSRALLVYLYDANGNPNNVLVKRVSLNDVPTNGGDAGDYKIYYNLSNVFPWMDEEAVIARAAVTVEKSKLAQWPAISIRAGNYTTSDDVGDTTGSAYISLNGNNSNCKLITDPTLPPPPEKDISISVTAPDWDLGELPVGENIKTFTDTKDQLCFHYQPDAVSSEYFVIDADNKNGTANNHYVLRNVTDSSQTIPYRLTLNDGRNTPLLLPNTGNEQLKLDSSGRTCFSPTFRTSVIKTTKKGDYTDVLNFTIKTRS
ncbi:hypothetical protein QMK50_23915 [Pseudomonas sp. P5_152]|uniref:hypothetical protein n=1 Tax=Pseudomonas sp. P5_152 TaxID=3043442 RepID=UPI002A3613F4|nr:hypothetical protein [Pseudomonas sp. P5_152]MDX9668000.1 hypothetical protein [Pseudomonas sp. P5_152]